MDYEISLSGAGRRCWGASAGVVARDQPESGDDDLCGSDQPGSCAYADRDTAVPIGIEGGAIFEGQEFAPDVGRVSGTEEEVLGSAFVGARVLGGFERERDG